MRISAWARDSVAIAAGRGLISGYPDATFRPLASATRAEALTVVRKAIGLK